MITIDYDDLEMAYEFVSSTGFIENAAYVSLDTGEIYYVSEDDMDEEEDRPEDLETSDRYIAVPSKHDLDLGNQLVFRFVKECLPDEYDTVRQVFRGRGAYARFKNMLDSIGKLDQWYEYEADATKQALTEWCDDCGIQLTEKPKPQ